MRFRSGQLNISYTEFLTDICKRLLHRNRVPVFCIRIAFLQFRIQLHRRHAADIQRVFRKGARKVEKNCFDELYYRLISSEYHIGRRKGFIHIYLAAVIHEFKQSVLITDRFGQVATSTDTLLQINAEPKKILYKLP